MNPFELQKGNLFLQGENGGNDYEKMLSFGLCVATYVFLADCGNSFDLDSYKSQILEGQTAILGVSADLGHLGVCEGAYWEQFIKKHKRAPMVTDLVESGYSTAGEEYSISKEQIESTHNSIAQQYKSIVLVEVEVNETEQLSASYVEMYELYDTLYELVTSPSGNYNNFMSSLTSNLEDVRSASDDLSLFLS